MTTFLVTNAIIFFAFYVRSLTGFGSPLLCIPLLSLIYDLKFIVPVACIFEVIFSIAILPRIHHQIDKVMLLLLLLRTLVGSFVGVMIMQSFANVFLKKLPGVFIILFALHMLRGQGQPRRSLAKYWGGVAGARGSV